MPTPLMNPPATGVIPETGAKGFLKWAQQSMPDYYAVLSPQLINLARKRTLRPTRSAQLGKLYRGTYAARGAGFAGVHGLGDAYFSSPIAVNYTAQLTATPITVAPVDTSALTIPDITVPAGSTTSNAVSVAGTGSASNAFVTAVSAITGAVVAGTKAAAQVSANNSLLQTNLARAAQGLPPLTANTTAAGALLSSANLPLLLIVGVGIYLATR